MAKAKSPHEYDALVGLPILKDYRNIRQSSILSSEKCHRSFLFSQGYGIRAKSRFRGMDEGSYAHLTLRTLAQADTAGVPLAARVSARRAIATLLNRLVTQMKQDGPVPAEIIKARTLDANIGFAMGVRVWDQLKEKVKSLTLVDSEKHWTLKIGGYEASGQFDLVFKTGDTHWIFELKTTADDPSEFLMMKRRGIQAPLYVEAARTIYPKVEGMIMMAIKKPSCRRKGINTGDPQTLDDYVIECQEWWDGTGRWIKYAQDRAAKPPIAMSKCGEHGLGSPVVKARVERYIEMTQRDRTLVNFLPSEPACQIGPIKCPYRDICVRPESGWARVINDEYTTNEDPLRS